MKNDNFSFLTGEWKERIGTSAYKNVVLPALRTIDPEKSHELTIWLAKNRLTPVDRVPDDQILRAKVFGLTFSNPLGLAAGCDKQVAFNMCVGELFNCVHSLGQATCAI
jgi:hypothetical protein